MCVHRLNSQRNTKPSLRVWCFSACPYVHTDGFFFSFSLLLNHKALRVSTWSLRPVFWCGPIDPKEIHLERPQSCPIRSPDRLRLFFYHSRTHTHFDPFIYFFFQRYNVSFGRRPSSLCCFSYTTYSAYYTAVVIIKCFFFDFCLSCPVTFRVSVSRTLWGVTEVSRNYFKKKKTKSRSFSSSHVVWLQGIWCCLT